MVEMSYDLNRTVPGDDPDMVVLENFRSRFGEDGNVIAAGLQDSVVYTLNGFQKFRAFCDSVRLLEGVNEVLSLPRVRVLIKDTVNSKFILHPLFPKDVVAQAQLDSLLMIYRGQKFYAGQLVNEQNGAAMVLISVNKEVVQSVKRVQLTKKLLELGDAFTLSTGVKLHFAGLPFIRAQIAEQVKRELSLFLYL